MKRGAAVLLLVIILARSSSAHSHSHEPPHAKYSREVNEKAAQGMGLEEEYYDDDHGHTHGGGGGGGGCPFSHSHGHHEHAHTHDHDDKYSHGKHEHHDHHHSEDRHVHKDHMRQTFRRAEHRPHLWLYAIGATLLISAAPFFILFLIPIQDNSPSNGPWLKVLLAFGSGGLLGDAFLHLIPHATPAGSHSHSHSHSHEAGHSHAPHDMSVGGWVLTGIIAFLVVEKVVRLFREEDGHGHGHSHSHVTRSRHDSQSSKKGKAKVSDDELDEDDKSQDGVKEEEKPMVAQEGKPEGVKVAAYLNLAADFAHNFTDGLAIGASFVAGNTVGVVTMVTVLVHEIPHEIGDFAILVQSGYSKRKAMGIQLITALGALSGCLLSLWVADPSVLAEAAVSSWILPFTAGGFIYIATVSVIPELLEKSSMSQSLREIFALLTGIYMMYLIAMYE